MLFFIDTASIEEIKKSLDTGMVDGVTTNPSLIVRCGRPFLEVIAEICRIVGDRPVSAEATSEDREEMWRQAKQLAAIAPHVVVKLPLTQDGLVVCRRLRDEGIDVNMTLCFSPQQALLAAKAGATYVSPFVGRLEDNGGDCARVALLEGLSALFKKGFYPGFSTKILLSSIRRVEHVVEAFSMGADVVTLPPSIFYELYRHPLTSKGLEAFAAEWAQYEKGLPNSTPYDLE